jgi:hypothetical protein
VRHTRRAERKQQGPRTFDGAPRGCLVGTVPRPNLAMRGMHETDAKWFWRHSPAMARRDALRDCENEVVGRAGTAVAEVSESVSVQLDISGYVSK